MLKTNCKGCIFQFESNCGCKLNKPVYLEKDRQYTEGFCNFKRNIKWAHNNVLNEENKISLIVIDGNNTDEVVNLIESLDDDNLKTHINDIIIVVKKQNHNEIRKIRWSLSVSGIKWNLINIKDENLFDNKLTLDHIISNVKNNWFWIVKSNEKITYDKLSYIINTILDDRHSNIIGFLDEENDECFIANKFPFLEMEGNKDEPFFNKLKSFDNWQKLCFKANVK